MSKTAKFTNRLIHETSPYLRQHAHNPVDWYPWGEEALQRARSENKPILLSIGYAACHWCHVMEHESFEDEVTARLMNDNFICIKVDREERPDLDTIYMQATQLMSGHGGWPMTVFLTPQCVPYFAGTYYPPDNRHGMPSFKQVLTSLADAFCNRNQDVQENARKVKAALEKIGASQGVERDLSAEVIDNAVRSLDERYDDRNGGFGGAPKFPQPMAMALLLRHHQSTGSTRSLRMVTHSLEKMLRGGIYDHLGGGFARYSVDEYWLVPHFEKMLYDNAQLSALLVEAWQVTANEDFARAAQETIDYILRDMTSPQGGFYATEDADSEGEEGKFYVWKPQQIEEVLGDAAAAELVCEYYDVGPYGNFEHGRSILNIPRDADVVAAKLNKKTAELLAAVAQARPKLFAEREKRVRPGRDQKIITMWNGLMLDALARAAAAFKRPDYLEAARKNGDFLLNALWQEKEGRLLRVFNEGQAKLNGYLEDYASLANALLSLYEVTLELRWFVAARRIADRMLELFEDREGGGFFFTSRDHEQLITRFKDPYDNATPSGNSLAVLTLLRLHGFSGEAAYRARAEKVLRQMRDNMVTAPTGFGLLLCALDLYLEGATEIALVLADSAEPLRNAVFGRFLPRKVVAGMQGEDAAASSAIPLLTGKKLVDGKSAAYVCKSFACQSPVTDAQSLISQLQ